jgi:ABC-type lipoprotein release transport system permease subunit
MLLLKLAFLNIWRNPRRSILTILTVGAGLATLLFIWGFTDGTANGSRENIVRLYTGHIQIHAQGFITSLAPEMTIPQLDEIMASVRNQRQVVAVSPRVKCEVLMGSSANSHGLLLTGIDPVAEQKITDLSLYVAEGEFLEQSDQDKILIGFRLAEKLEVGVGDKVVVMSRAGGGIPWGLDFYVKGILYTGSQQVDELSAYVTITSAQNLVGVGDNIHELSIKTKDRRAADATADLLRKKLDSSSYQVSLWNDIVPEIDQWVEWHESIIRVVLNAVLILVGISVMNTILMSVLERLREFGVLMALGTSPRQISLLVFLETAILEIAGVVFGLVLGYGVIFFFGKVGISFKQFEQALSMTYTPTVIYTAVEPRNVVQTVFWLIGISSLINLYPALKAGRIEPVQAIYHSQ